jgi:hypothetical protein
MVRVKSFNAVLSESLQFSSIHVSVRVGVDPNVEIFKLGARNFTICKKNVK